MAKRSFKITPIADTRRGRLKQPDYWALVETTGGEVKEVDRYPSYPEALRANREICSRLPL
ncbi:hypothetical protein [Modicisalibacter luteus]|uniref:Uncharacterized protein n=1 Tax=Modicisalibacter luteus TaxID=453962 RepID=A0ABV7LZ21_9GAMM|nr:hypothetical protein [Halomonas lutea]GHA95844.1 hypothetical protein GCM10007159_16720 [Halomonas lutea]